MAIDGNESYIEAQCASTINSPDPFLRIDLKRPHLITKVDVKFYDSGGNRSTVRVGGNLINSRNYQCGPLLSYENNSGDFYSFVCSKAQLGQYVVVSISGTVKLQVCEICIITGKPFCPSVRIP